MQYIPSYAYLRTACIVRRCVPSHLRAHFIPIAFACVHPPPLCILYPSHLRACRPDVVFHKLLTEGAFEVSARKQDGRTAFVQIADTVGGGRSCVVMLPADFSAAKVVAQPSAAATLEVVDGGLLRVTFAASSTTVVLVKREDATRPQIIESLPGVHEKFNYWGTRI